MARHTIDRRAPPLFRHGPSLRSRWLSFAIFSVLMMLADHHWHWAQPVRTALSVAMAPVQALVRSPVEGARHLQQYFADLKLAQSQAARAEKELASLAAQRAELMQLRRETADLRQLLDLQQQRFGQGLGAEVVLTAPDPYSRKVIIDKGSQHGVQLGSPVLDAFGVLGQVTQLYLRSAEVSLLIGQGFTVPVRNQRTGELSVAYGVPHAALGQLELRYLPSTADVKVGDVLTTSGLDGVYPPALTVATIDSVDRRSDTTFVKVFAQPVGQMSAKYVLVVQPLGLHDLEPEALALAQGALRGQAPAAEGQTVSTQEAAP